MQKCEFELINAFHKMYYYLKMQTWGNTYWQGTPVLKCPLDLWIYQEILYELQPDLIIECGTGSGGSAHYLASLCDLLSCGIVVSIDVEDRAERPIHSRITYLRGSSVEPNIVSYVQELAAKAKMVMVILDSDHRCSHVLQELRLYGPLVTPGSYIIVEDTNLNGHPVAHDFGPGPWEAVELFLAETTQFMRDAMREKFMITANPGGYLRRLRNPARLDSGWDSTYTSDIRLK